MPVRPATAKEMLGANHAVMPAQPFHIGLKKAKPSAIKPPKD
jgi:hypothetical protein